jgi:hypothetical protein
MFLGALYKAILTRRKINAMSRYMVVTPHKDKECLKLVEWVQAQGYLHQFDWGCGDGEHCGWAILEADDAEKAKLVVPPILREKARVFKLNKYKDEDVIAAHSAV